MSQSSSPDFAVECRDCDESAAGDSFEPIVTFAEKHKEHTEHDIEWTAAHFEGMDDLLLDESWRVTCDHCDTEWEFPSEDEAQTFYDEHDTYTDHEANPPTKHEDEVTVRSVKSLIDQCLEAGDFGRGGVPIPLVLKQADHLGTSQRQIQEQIDKLYHQGEAYKPHAGYIRLT